MAECFRHHVLVRFKAFFDLLYDLLLLVKLLSLLMVHVILESPNTSRDW